MLVGRGAREPGWAAPMERIAMQLRSGGERVELAFLEHLEPELGKALDMLCRDGIRNIRVVPVILGAGGQVLDGVAQRVDTARGVHAEARIAVAPPLGGLPKVSSAIADAIALRITPASKAGGE
ncbi:MAG TPA: CbiX/SirB N-terminal domain-containing protein [Burkholderiales bacterium]|nr:CbiX/SirB N-terminal domain-containing protein [Burkholderiales bacterium]